MVLDNLRKLIGRTKIRRYSVTALQIRRFAQAIGETNPIHYDESYANATRYGSIIAPPLFCQTFIFEDLPLEKLPADGSPAELDIPIPARRAVGGGSSFELYGVVRAGDMITVASKLKDVYTKEGKNGLLYFIVVETSFSNQHDALVGRETATYIKRE